MTDLGSSGSGSAGIRGPDGADGQPPTLLRVAGAIGIVAQVASAYWYVLYPALVVPSPTNYVFFLAWFVLVGLAVAWWRRHPGRSFLLPVISVPLVVLVL